MAGFGFQNANRIVHINVVFVFGAFSFGERTGIRLVSKRLDLSPKEYDLLYVLARAAGTTKSREELLLEVWDIDFDPGTNVLDVHIGRLRRKLDRLGRPLIQTVRGEGYRIDRPVPSTNV